MSDKTKMNTNNKGTEKVFFEEKSSDSDSLNSSYSQLVRDISKQSLTAIMWFVVITVLFGAINLAFICYDAFNFSQFSNGYITIILALIVSVISLFLTFNITYRCIIIDTLGLAYKYLTPLFKKICIKIIDVVVSGSNKISGKDINKSLNVGALMIEIYGNKAPKYLQKGLVFVIDRIPFSDFLKQMQKDLSENKSSETLSEILYKNVHNYLSTIFQDNSIKPIFIVFLINIILQIAIIFLI